MDKRIAEAVLERSNGECEVCGRRGSELHHIIYGSGKRKQCERVEGVVLPCMECHRGDMGVHGRDGRETDLMLKRYLQKIYFGKGYSEEETRKLMGGRLY